MTRVLVTGAGGFIGRRLCAALAPRCTVRALLRREAEGPWHEAVVADMTAGVPAEATAGVDAIVHLAARTHAVDDSARDEALYRAINVDATRALLEAAGRSGVRRIVFASSVKALGEGGDAVVTDDTAPAPTTAYGRTKLEAERLVLGAGHVPEAVVLRPCLVYGPGAKGNTERMIAAIAAGWFPPVPETGNRRSMVHVDDVVTALAAALDSPVVTGRAFIVTDRRYYSTREIYTTLCRALGKAPRQGWPLWVFRSLAAAGDMAGRILGRRAPIDGETLSKLFGSAAYDGSRLWEALGMEPAWDLERAADAMIKANKRLS